MTKLVVVIVSWNTSDLTRQCLRTLVKEIESINHEIWIVDNDSSDDTAEMIKRDFPRARLIVNNDNVGFARANNQILRQAKGEYFLLLNTDTIIPEGSLRALVRFMDENPAAGAAGPKLRNAQGVTEAGLKPLPTLPGELGYCLIWHFFPFNFILKPTFEKRIERRLSVDKPAEAEVLSAACLIIRHEVIDEVGVLAEDYFLFSEENDYFYRMRKAGFKGYYLPNIEVIHLIGMSRRKRGKIDSDINFFRSRMLFFRKFHRGGMPLFKLIYYFFFGWSYLVAVGGGMFRKPKGDENYVALYRRLLLTLWREGRI